MMSAETVRRRIKGALGQKDDAEEPEVSSPPSAQLFLFACEIGWKCFLLS